MRRADRKTGHRRGEHERPRRQQHHDHCRDVIGRTRKFGRADHAGNQLGRDGTAESECTEEGDAACQKQREFHRQRLRTDGGRERIRHVIRAVVESHEKGTSSRQGGNDQSVLKHVESLIFAAAFQPDPMPPVVRLPRHPACRKRGRSRDLSGPTGRVKRLGANYHERSGAEAGGWRLEAGGWRLEAGGWGLGAGVLRPRRVARLPARLPDGARDRQVSVPR